MASDLRKSLQASWVHSHEEDEGNRLVFRGPDHDFPPARGRTSFTLKPGGEVDAVGPGPDDRRRSSSGTWSLEGKHLRIDSPLFSGTYQVETVDDEHMVIKRIEEK